MKAFWKGLVKVAGFLFTYVLIFISQAALAQQMEEGEYKAVSVRNNNP